MMPLEGVRATPNEHMYACDDSPLLHLEELSENNSDQDVDQVLSKMNVYVHRSLEDPQLDLFWLEEKRKLLYGKRGVFSENPYNCKLINPTLYIRKE